MLILHNIMALPSLMSPGVCGCLDFCCSCEGHWGYKVAWTCKYSVMLTTFFLIPSWIYGFFRDRLALASSFSFLTLHNGVLKNTLLYFSVINMINHSCLNQHAELKHHKMIRLIGIYDFLSFFTIPPTATTG